MPEDHRPHGWGPPWWGHGHTGHGTSWSGGRPPWWPEGEPFPPEGRAGMRRRFLRRILLVFGGFLLLMVAANAVAFWLLGRVSGEHRRAVPFVVLLIFGSVVALVAFGRAVRRMAGPMGDVMDAADRLAGGDLSTRVEEHGPREVRRLARSFNAMAERLEATEEQRRNLLADIAHELRTPLTVIQGATEGMLDGLYPADREHLEPVLEGTKVMARLLEDLQTLSMAEAGALRLHREPVDPADAVADATAALADRAERAGVDLRADVAPGLAPVAADPVRVNEVLVNLLSNAIRHSPSGSTVVVAAEPAGDGAVAFEVRDAGPGIAPDLLPHVFDRFVRSADSGGAGLGLAIARSLVEAHGGTISASSGPDGTTMRALLPRG